MTRALGLLCVYAAFAAGPPVREIKLPIAPVDGVLPGFDQGFTYTFGDTGDSLTLFSRGGSFVWLDLADLRGTSTKAASLAVGPDRSFAIALSFPAEIDFFDRSGQFERSIETGNYRPSYVAFGGDHSLWALGFTGGVPSVRHYSPGGVLMGEYARRAAGLETAKALAVSRDRVGIRTAAEWQELDLKGGPAGRWSLPGSRTALTADGHAYAQNGAALFRLDRAAGKWVKVSGPAGALWGADGNELVFLDAGYLRWYAQP